MGTIPSVKLPEPPESLQNMQIKQTETCTKISYANANGKKHNAGESDIQISESVAAQRDNRKALDRKCEETQVHRRELQSSAGGHQGQNQLEHSSGLIVTSPLQVSLLTLKQTIYTYIFIYIRVYRIHPDSGYKIEDNHPNEKK